MTNLSVHTELLHRGATDPLANWLLPSALSFGGLLAAGLIGAAFGMSQSELVGDAVVPEAPAIATVIGSPAQPSMRIEGIHHVKTLPVEKFHDMSFVFSDGDSTAGVIAAAASEEPRKNWFTPRCAERDLHAFVVIEELGDLGEVPTAWLADAGLNYVQARGYCLSGAESEGVKLYDRIIASDVRLPKEWTMNQRVQR